MTESNNRIWHVNEKNGLWMSSPISRRQLFAGAGGVALLGTLAACGGEAPNPSGSTSGSKTGAPKRGGDFRLGVTGGGADDTFDGQHIVTKPDIARLVSSFETLLTFDDEYQLQTDGLAESVEADGPQAYVIRLRSGIEFHDGKTVTADDVIYSLQRIGTEKLALVGFAATATMDLANMKKMDDLTVRLPLHSPDVTVPETLASYTWGIVPVGYERFKGDPSTQIGTGAYKLKSFTPGQESVSERNDNYWRGDGSPWFDTVTITNFQDPTAQVNALQADQIDAMTDLPAAQVEAIKSKGLNVLNSQTGGWLPLCMAVDMPPFDDNRVRQAMRLIIDREGMIEQLASGYATLANDLYSPFDVGYFADLPQREQDIDQAKSLLKQAGAEGLQVDLHTTNGAGRNGRVRERLRDAGQGGRGHGQRQERTRLLLRVVPQGGVLGGLLGHPRLPQPGPAGIAADLAVQRDALAPEVRRRVQLRRPVPAGGGRAQTRRRGSRSSTRCSSWSTTSAATSSRSSPT